MATTLVLHPTGLSDITFTCLEETDAYITNFGVIEESLSLGTEDRLAVQYAQSADGEFGEAVTEKGQLTRVSFRCFVVGTTKAAMINNVDTLFRAIMNQRGGTLEYKPDYLGGGIASTYYHYLQSSPPRKLVGEDNTWSRGTVKSKRGIELYVLAFDVRLMTLPYATSDPDSPVLVLPTVTLDNTDDVSRNNATTIPAANIEGNVDALTRVRAHPVTAGTEVDRLIMARRTYGLGTFQATYNSVSYLSPTSVWAAVNDALRSGGQYHRCTPTIVEREYCVRYAISNWADHSGRAAIVLTCRDNSAAAGRMYVRASWSIANTPLSGDYKALSATGIWTELILAEFDIPETEMSEQEDLDLYVDIGVKKVSGSGTFDVDTITLMFTDESVMEVLAPADVGADTGQSFLIENFKAPIAHIIDHSTNKLEYICNLHGEALRLRPGSDNRLDILWAREQPDPFDDTFSSYSAYWDKIADMEISESWVFTAGSSTGEKTDIYMEGSQSIGGTGGDVVAYLDTDIDLSDVPDTSFICLSCHSYRPSSRFKFRLYTNVPGNYFESDELPFGAFYNYFGVVSQKKSEFNEVGSPSWDSPIVRLEVIMANTSYPTGNYVRFDNLRVSSVDPDDSSTYNDTGGVWGPYSGAWNVQELTGGGKQLGCHPRGFGAGSSRAMLADLTYTNLKMRAKISWKNLSFTYVGQGSSGLVFRCSDPSEGSLDAYAVSFSTGSLGRLRLSEITNGSSTPLVTVNLAPGLTFEKDTDYYIGVIASGNSIQVYLSDDEDTLWDAANRRIDTTDSTHSSGQVGLTSGALIARFDDFYIEPLVDRHIITDQMQVTVWAIFRTTIPFGESF